MDERETDLTLPSDLWRRLNDQFTADIDQRVKDLTLLVSLQETELTYLWFTIIALSTYIIVKEHRHGR